MKVLLGKLGYAHDGKCYRHPDRMAVFVGDLIDRGTKIWETLELVKAMESHGCAFMTMGNHEYNAVCYCTRDDEGERLRAHSKDNRLQLQVTRDAVADDESGWQGYLDWFRDLPLYLNFSEFRVARLLEPAAH